ncbi:MAG: 2Fe-2S iron-sulfur cluster-binding protein [Pseudorhodoplanes sp.]|uniref:PDR/VanB family oxidoreductase n=1 Tax=Pseudorhodoplanes sp. TaxID=1934341 RepID=UPI003D0B8B84
MRVIETWTAAHVRAARNITPTIRLFELVPAAGSPAQIPLGGHLNVTVMIGDRADTRSYSLIGPALPDAYRIAVKRTPESRGGSAYMWSLREGAQITVSSPRSHFEIDFGRPDYLVIAGGIGITPLVGMAHALAHEAARSGASLRMAYCARSRDELAFADDLRARLGERLQTFVSREGQRLDVKAELTALGPGGIAAVCGPLPLLDEARRVWRELGRPHADLRFETFGSSGTFATEPFRLRIAQSGQEIVVPETQTILDALEDAGIGVISDCRRGECGVCALNIVAIDGQVDHRDVFFSDHQKHENKKLCACVSRAIGTLTIDPMLRPDPSRP